MSLRVGDDAVALPAAEVRELFPFLLKIDRGLRLVEVGRSVATVCPEAQVGAPWLVAFSLVRPTVAITFEALASVSDLVVWLEATSTGVRLRGRLSPCDGGAALLFLGSPWFTEFESIERVGLSSHDLSTIDPLADLLSIVRAKQAALDEA